MFYHGSENVIVYVYDGMFLGRLECQLSNTVKKLQDIYLDIEEQGHPADYVGVNIQRHDDGSYAIKQCVLIDSITEDVGLSSAKATTKPILASVQKPLHALKDSSFNNDFNYHSVVGKINYIAQTT